MSKPTASRKRPTHCKHNHEWTPENTYVNPTTGYRDCRTCIREAVHKYKAANPEKVREMNRNYRGENPEYDCQYHAANREKRLETSRNWIEANPDKRRAHIRKSGRKRKALKLEQLGLWNHMESQIEELMYRSQKGRCYYCHEILDWEDRNNSPLEHKIPLSRGKPGDGLHGTLNWCISCRDCNSRKGTKTVEEFQAA